MEDLRSLIRYIGHLQLFILPSPSPALSDLSSTVRSEGLALEKASWDPSRP